MINRRAFLKLTAGSLFLTDAVSLFAASTQLRKSWKIGICDWDLKATGLPTSFAIAKELGFEGVQVTYQPDGPDSLALKTNCTRFMEASKLSGVSIASFCIGTFNSRPLATTPEAEKWVAECIETMVEMNIDQVLVPFFGRADINDNKAQQPIVIEKLKRLAPLAEKNRKTLAIESYLSAEDHLKLFEAVGSNALRTYYDVQNSRNKSYDIFHEMELLGKNKLISQIHFKEDRRRLGEGEINFSKVCETLEKIGYNGWVVIESSTQGDWKESQSANLQFIKKLLNG